MPTPAPDGTERFGPAGEHATGHKPLSRQVFAAQRYRRSASDEPIDLRRPTRVSHPVAVQDIDAAECRHLMGSERAERDAVAGGSSPSNRPGGVLCADYVR